MATIGHQQSSDGVARAQMRTGDRLVAAAVVLAVPLVALGLLSLPQLGGAGFALLLAVLVVGAAVLVAWRRRGWVRWRPVLVGVGVGGTVSLGTLAWFAVAFSRSMEAMG